jgi:hypothetical protein
MPFLQKILTFENDDWRYTCAIRTDGCHYSNIFFVAIALCFLSPISSGSNDSRLFATAKWKPTFIKAVKVVQLDVVFGKGFLKVVEVVVHSSRSDSFCSDRIKTDAPFS